MGRIVPNEESWIGFIPWPKGGAQPIEDLKAPTVAEINTAVDFTCYVVSINASAQGNTVPTPSICSLFETSVPGTSQAQFQADFYRDDADDAAWEALKRGDKGIFIVSRFGGSGPAAKPAAADKVEVWPVQVTTRAAAALSSNTAQTFSVTAAVNIEPAEDAVVAAAAVQATKGSGGTKAAPLTETAS